MTEPAPFDPDAASQPGSGIFGLPHGEKDAAVWLMPVPFDATTSYGGGAMDGPAAIRQASHQVDLFDLQTGRSFERGIYMLPESAAIRAASIEARRLAVPIVERGGARESDRDAVQQVEAAGAEVNRQVAAFARRALQEGRVPGVVGGDHAAPLGAMQVVAERFPGLGILHVDAHMDLREAYEGFVFSHASVMHNVLQSSPGVARLVQVGVRDFAAAEFDAGCQDPRVVTHFDLTWRQRMAVGETFAALCQEVVAALPQNVYVSFDIDGLDPALCPNTGTPVPGGLDFAQASLLLQYLVESGRRIVGFDLCEVCPADSGEDEWDGNVGARILYKLCGFAILSTSNPAD